MFDKIKSIFKGKDAPKGAPTKPDAKAPAKAKK